MKVAVSKEVETNQRTYQTEGQTWSKPSAVDKLKPVSTTGMRKKGRKPRNLLGKELTMKNVAIFNVGLKRASSWNFEELLNEPTGCLKTE